MKVLFQLCKEQKSVRDFINISQWIAEYNLYYLRKFYEDRYGFWDAAVRIHPFRNIYTLA